MSRHDSGEPYDALREYQKAQESREELDRYLDENYIEVGEIKQIANLEKRTYLLNLCECLHGKIGVSDKQKRMAAREIRGIDYPRKRDLMTLFCENKKEYVIYPRSVYAYRAFLKENSLIAIAGRFKDNLTDEEKSLRRSERLFKSNGANRLLLSYPPFNPLYLFTYGSKMPEIPKKMDDLLFEDAQNAYDML